MHTRLLFSEQKPSNHVLTAVCLVESVDLDTSDTIAQLHEFESYSSAIHVNVNFEVVIAVLESRVQGDIHGKRGTSDCFDIR